MVQDFIESYAVLLPLLPLFPPSKLSSDFGMFLHAQDVDGDGKLAYDELDLCMIG
jgi:hypothetical protein